MRQVIENLRTTIEDEYFWAKCEFEKAERYDQYLQAKADTLRAVLERLEKILSA